MHFGAFLLLGIGLVRLVRWAASESIVRYALLQVFLVFEVFFYGLLMLASEATRALFPFWTVLIARGILAVHYSNLPWAGLRTALAAAFAAFVAIWALWLSRRRHMPVVVIALFLGVVV